MNNMKTNIWVNCENKLPILGGNLLDHSHGGDTIKKGNINWRLHRSWFLVVF